MPNEVANSILPIICDRVIIGSTIFADENKSYLKLISKRYIHKIVCHKYNFVDKKRGYHTQFEESFNNKLK